MKLTFNILEIIKQFVLDFVRIIHVKIVIDQIAEYSGMSRFHNFRVPGLGIPYIPVVIITPAPGEGRRVFQCIPAFKTSVKYEKFILEAVFCVDFRSSGFLCYFL